MTRVLSELLGADQPRFGVTIRQLEAAIGKPSTDIRLTSEITQRAQQKIRALGLDPQDTTGTELYHALVERFHNDEYIAREALKLAPEATPDSVLDASVAFVGGAVTARTALALKNSVAKRLLKKVPPKRAMKQLGYRSLDSMLKHEAIAHLYVAAFLYETPVWRKKFLDQYNALQPNDFELRRVEISVPKTARWESVGKELARQQPPVAVFKELGAVVAVKTDAPTTAIATLTLLLGALNDIQGATSFLKLQQMKPDFGTFVRTIAEQEPMTRATLMDKTVPWRVVHQYYARFRKAYNPLIFEPHIQPSDLEWLHPESLLSKLHPAIDFWHDTRYTAYTHNIEKVSMNVFDVARSYTERLSYAQRSLQALRVSLWQELMIRYLDQANVEQAIAGDLATEPVFADIEEV